MTLAFRCGDELDRAGRPRILRHPEYFDPGDEPFAEMGQAYAPLVCIFGRASAQIGAGVAAGLTIARWEPRWRVDPGSRRAD